MNISVITVCYNSAKTIRYTLDSFFRQTHPDKELVVIDGGSTDETLNIVRSFQREMIVVSEPDRGLYDAMNKGLRRFNGDAVGFLNSDDRFHDDSVLSQIAEAPGQADVAFGNIRFVSDHVSGRVLRTWRGSSHERGTFRNGWMPAHPSFYVARSVVAAVGSFDLGYSIAADYDWMLRALEVHAFSSIFLDRPCVDMALGGKSTGSISAYIRGNLESLRSRREHLGVGLVDIALLAKPLRKITQFAARGLGRGGDEMIEISRRSAREPGSNQTPNRLRRWGPPFPGSGLPVDTHGQLRGIQESSAIEHTSDGDARRSAR